MMELNVIYNESNIETLKRLENKSIDLVLTSPFYNTNHKSDGWYTLSNTPQKNGQYSHLRYDVFADKMSNKEYTDYILTLFNGFSTCLKDNGVVLFNISYGSDNPTGMFDTVSAICRDTGFTMADVIIWKKKSALPNNMSPNKLTRICEFVFVFVKKDFYETFHMNKTVISRRDNGQAQYQIYYNFIEAANNDGPCEYNKATYSTELCTKLLNMYGIKDGVCYDPFMGSGTTAVACKLYGMNYIGSEISENQVQFANKRIQNTAVQLGLFDL